MELQEFITEFANAIEIDPGSITADTEFKELEIWDSLSALNVIAMTDEAHGVTLSGDDLVGSRRIADLWTLIKERSGK